MEKPERKAKSILSWLRQALKLGAAGIDHLQKHTGIVKKTLVNLSILKKESFETFQLLWENWFSIARHDTVIQHLDHVSLILFQKSQIWALLRNVS